MKIALASPTYGAPDPLAQKHLRVAMMVASNNGVKWTGDVSSIRMGWADGRDRTAKSIIDEPDCDGIFWVDDDILLPSQAIIQLVSYGKDFTSGVYFQKVPPHYPLIAAFNGDTFNWLVDYTQLGENVIAEVDGVGFGCAFTSMKLLRAIRDKHDKIFEWTRYSEDFTFSLRAGELGMKPWVDTGIKCRHGHEVQYIGEEEFLIHRKTNKEAVNGGNVL